MFKIVIVGLFLAIVLSLVSAGVALLRDRGHGTATVRALTWRISLSLLLFVLLLIGYGLGWIHPHAPPS
jgi:hypothetical protein